MDDIHFLITELEENIQHKIQDVLKDLEKPKPQQQNPLLKRFTEELIFAAARKQHPMRQQKKEAKEFQQLKDVEQQPLPQQQIFILQQAPQPFYNRENIPSPPQQQVTQQWTAAVQQQNPSPVFQPSQLPSAQSTQQQPQAQPKTPTDETLPFTPSALPLQPMPQTPPTSLQSIPVPQPQAPQLTPIAVTVPKEVEPPIALIVDAEFNKPIVTVTIQNDIYTINEPQLSQREVSMITWLRKKLLRKEKKVSNKKKLNKKIWKAARKMKFPMQKNDEGEYLKMKYYLVKHLLNFGWIEPLFHDDAITKMICEGENQPIMIIRKDKTLKTNIAYPNADYINLFLKKFAAKAYKQVSEKNPSVDITANGFHVEGSLKTAATPAKFTVTRV